MYRTLNEIILMNFIGSNLRVESMQGRQPLAEFSLRKE